MRVVFQEVRLYGSKTVECESGCGRKLRRSKKFYQTLNPFNKTNGGLVKSRSDILAELRTEITAWKSQTEVCSHCGSEKAS